MTRLLIPERRIVRPTVEDRRRLHARNIRGITSPYRHLIGNQVAAIQGGAEDPPRGLFETLRDGTAAGLSMNPAAVWNFDESSGDYLDRTGNANNLSFISNHTRNNWTGPDGASRATAANGSCYESGASGVSTSAGFSLVWACFPTTAQSSGIFFGPYSGTASITNIRYDNANTRWEVVLGRTTGATHSWDHWTLADPAAQALHIITVPNSTTPTPTWRYNGAVQTLTRLTGPNGLWQQTASFANFRAYYANSTTFYGKLGPMAFFNAPLSAGDITIIEDAATNVDGWY